MTKPPKKYSKDGKSVLNILEFKQRFNVHLETFLKNKVKSIQKNTKDESINRIINQATLIARSGGKRVRPYIAYLGYSLNGGKVSDELFDVLVGIELFHVFALIHDDIIDEGDERHSQETIHKFAEKILPFAKYKKHFGASQALLAGDLVFAWSQQALLGNASISSLEAVREIYNKMIEEVVIGQMIDVVITNTERVSKNDIEEKNRLKTARYTFVNPLKIGAALKTNSKKYDKFFEEFGLALGTGYQVQDDLLDICGDSKDIGKDIMKDLEKGQHTYFTQYIFDEGNDEQKNLLKSLFGNQLNESQKSEAKKLFESSGAIDAGRSIILRKIDSAKKILIKYSVPKSHHDAFSTIISIIEQRTL